MTHPDSSLFLVHSDTFNNFQELFDYANREGHNSSVCTHCGELVGQAEEESVLV